MIIEKISISTCRDRFILKGGMLIASSESGGKIVIKMYKLTDIACVEFVYGVTLCDNNSLKLIFKDGQEFYYDSIKEANEYHRDEYKKVMDGFLKLMSKI
jgi:hypothetical protein